MRLRRNSSSNTHKTSKSGPVHRTGPLLSLPISLGNIHPPVVIPVTTPSFAVTVFLYRRPRESKYEYV